MCCCLLYQTLANFVHCMLLQFSQLNEWILGYIQWCNMAGSWNGLQLNISARKWNVKCFEQSWRMDITLHKNWPLLCFGQAWGWTWALVKSQPAHLHQRRKDGGQLTSRQKRHRRSSKCRKKLSITFIVMIV